MTLFEILPLAAAVVFAIVTLTTLFGAHSTQGNWKRPAIIFAAFLAFSLYAVFTEGILGFWPNHTQDAWGNQVWFDLLIAIGIAWILILPRARAQNMKLPLWLVFIMCSGCIGVLAMLARLYVLESRGTETIDP
jgi:hypothetical protein